MLWIYRFSLFAYKLLIQIASLFNEKASLWISGRKNIWQKISQFQVLAQHQVLWMHVSSLGEFEQGRPLIEQIKKNYHNIQIIITFFSPSGYEIRKNYTFADAIFYLPLDSPKNAQRFYDIIKPNWVIFVKYDFWFFYIREAYLRKIPIFLISAVFKPNQIFFKFYGHFYRKMLRYFSQIYVQDDTSKLLLQKININSIVAGDTRCDRVLQIAQSPLPLNNIRDFIKQRVVVIVGSAWDKDIKILKNIIEQTQKNNVLWIIAPHVVNEEHIQDLIQIIDLPAIRYTQINDINNNIKNGVLWIDTIGILSSLYQFATIAYIGGGFGKGIHNTLEPASFGVPVVFGPNYHKFNEAEDMIKLGAAFSISNADEAFQIINQLIQNETFRSKASIKAQMYIQKSAGATQKIIQQLFH
ncbi:MAG: 3-deoxy-D-manno-octulosonic acid transferase [Bacteroidales bacterium]|nr:3-deoxy-D-manno-octulosonic acid transferase [Bacteroidales bacterium]